MDDKLKKEEISKAMLNAVCAPEGWKIARWSQDTYCLDASIQKRSEFGYICNIDIQLKCTSKPKIQEDGTVCFYFKPDHTKQIRGRIGDSRFVLVFMPVPEILDKWVTHFKDDHNEKHMTTRLKYSAYAKQISDGINCYFDENKVVFNKDEIFDGEFLKKFEEGNTPEALSQRYIEM